MEREEGLMKLKVKAERARAHSQYRVSVSPGDILRLIRDYEALQAEHAQCPRRQPPDSRLVLEI